MSPCSSLFISVQQPRGKHGNPSASRVLDPHCVSRQFVSIPSLLINAIYLQSITGPLGKLEKVTDEGHSALSRHRKKGEILDIERSIVAFQHVLDNCPLDHPYHAVAQSNLAMAQFTRCQADVSDTSLDVPISLYHEVLAARPTSHPDRPSTLIQLARVHTLRFERKRDAVDAERAEGLLREAMYLSSAESHERKLAVSALQLHAGRTKAPVHGGGPLSMNRDSVSGLPDADSWTVDVKLIHCFEQFGDSADLQQAISILEVLISDSTQDDRHLALLGNLGIALWYRFAHLHNPDDLEQAISKQADAINLTPDDHPDKPGRLNSLGNTLFTRFVHSGNLSDLDRAISRHSNSVDLTPDGHSDKPRRLNNLADSLIARFERLGNLNDLEQAIRDRRQGIQVTPDSHPDKPRCLNNLANCYRIRFEHLGESGDLEQAISGHRKAMELDDHNKNHHVYLNSLAVSFLVRFKHLGNLSDLEDAISKQKEAIKLTPDDNCNKPAYLNDLAMSLLTRFEWFSELDDLEQGISRLREAVTLAADGHPDNANSLNNLGTCFRARFTHLGQPLDLEQAISRHREAIQVSQKCYTNKLCGRKHLDNTLITRSRLGHRSSRWQGDLELAISTYREAVRLTSDRHTDKRHRLNSLANCLLARFEHFGELRDLEEAELMHHNAVQLENATPVELVVSSASDPPQSSPSSCDPCPTRTHGYSLAPPMRGLGGHKVEDGEGNDQPDADK